MATDAEVIQGWSDISDPREALSVIAGHFSMLCGDSYYRDFQDGLFALCERLGLSDQHREMVQGDL